MPETLISAALTRVGIIGDVHAEDEALAAALAYFKAMQIETICCTGDVVTGKGDANRCCHLLEASAVYTVRGNHDRWFFTEEYADQLPDATPAEALDMDARAFLATLPTQLAFDTPLGRMLLGHGTGSDDMLGVYPGDSDAVLSGNWKLQKLYAEQHFHILVGGHTHHRMVRPFEHLTLINPGTLRRDKKPGFAYVDFSVGAVTFFDLREGNTVYESETILLPIQEEYR